MGRGVHHGWLHDTYSTHRSWISLAEGGRSHARISLDVSKILRGRGMVGNGIKMMDRSNKFHKFEDSKVRPLLRRRIESKAGLMRAGVHRGELRGTAGRIGGRNKAIL